MTLRPATVLLLLACAPLLNACVVLFGGAAVGGALVATDRRSVGIQLEDAAIEHRINDALEERFQRESVHIEVYAYAQKVLLAGKVPNEKARQDAERIARESRNVREVYNDLAMGELAGLDDSSGDSMLAAKVRSSLLDTPGLTPGVLKVHCASGTIYLFGRVTEPEASVAKRGASHVDGVKRVVALFDIVPEEEVSPPAPVPTAAPAPAAAQPAP